MNRQLTMLEMGVRIRLAAALMLTGLSARPAAAAFYRFDVVDPTARVGGDALLNDSYTFYVSTTPAEFLSVQPVYFVVQATEYFSTATLANQSRTDTITFFVGSFFGGFQSGFSQYNGPQLFTGTTDQPTFKISPFTFQNSRASLTISEVSNLPGVPEAATWTMMMGGLGLVGASLRGRKATATFA